MVTEPEFLVAKEKMLVTLATVSVVISSPGDSLRLIRDAPNERCVLFCLA